MNRQEALALVRERVRQENLVRHMLATEAIMGALARRLGEPEERWKLAGLLHDLDVEETTEHFNQHGLLATEWLRERGFADEQVLGAIRAHNPANGTQPSNLMEKALFACDCLTGLITAAALIRPEKKLAFVTLKSLKKRFKEPAFAKGARREDIMTCTELGLELDEFLELGLNAMQEVADELRL
ncbi:MAG: HDIG domain-containing protein [Thermoleophilia bacterium]|nr:HDIG domain-containing protein [Thermoleophilia bacterium]